MLPSALSAAVRRLPRPSVIPWPSPSAFTLGPLYFTSIIDYASKSIHVRNILRHCVIVNKKQGCFIKEINSSTVAINVVSKWETSHVQLMVLETVSCDTDSIDDCGNVEHKNVDVHSEEHEGAADDQNEPTKHADADVAPDVYTNILELTEADIGISLSGVFQIRKELFQYKPENGQHKGLSLPRRMSQH
ncbi:hypothetical protein RIF29_04777 [Crotalaria pallida]|uniref:Uncharacterized protein n=1 Tax=Crotalaria pallida TaxID=3830 RepID=A0AAN9J244_CROPI